MCAASQAVMYLVSVRPEAVNPCTILVGNNDFVKKKANSEKSHRAHGIQASKNTLYTRIVSFYLYENQKYQKIKISLTSD